MCQPRKTTLIRRTTVWETGVSRQSCVPIQNTPWNPSDYQSTTVLTGSRGALNWASIQPRNPRLSANGCHLFPSVARAPLKLNNGRVSHPGYRQDILTVISCVDTWINSVVSIRYVSQTLLLFMNICIIYDVNMFIHFCWTNLIEANMEYIVINIMFLYMMYTSLDGDSLIVTYNADSQAEGVINIHKLILILWLYKVFQAKILFFSSYLLNTIWMIFLRFGLKEFIINMLTDLLLPDTYC